MAYENFTTYTEVDLISRVSVATNTITANPRTGTSEDWYVYYDKGSGYFGATFSHYTETKISNSPYHTGQRGGIWAVSNTVATNDYWFTNNSQAVLVGWYDGLHLLIQESETDNNDESSLLNADTLYYLTVERLDTVSLECRIYSDTERTTLVDTITISLTSGRTYQYIFPLVGFTNDYGEYSATLTSQNLDLAGTPTPPAPWLSGWGYRKKVVLTGQTGAGTNYQVLLKIGATSSASGEHFDLAGHSLDFPADKNDGGDLTFTDNDGQTQLDFWVESVSGSGDSALANVWVEVADNLEGTQFIYCYYGKSGASNLSSGTNTFIVFDDFNGGSLDASIWSTYQIDSAVQSSSILTTSATSKDPSKVIMTVGGSGPTGNNIALRTLMRITTGSDVDQRAGAGIKCGTGNGQGYNYLVHDFTNLDEGGKFLDDYVAWGSNYIGSWAKNTWYIFDIAHNGSAVIGRRADDGTWRSEGWSGRTGYPALNNGGYNETAGCDWDWAFARKCVLAEPAFSTVSIEENVSVDQYSKQGMGSLPSTDAVLANTFGVQEYTDVGSDNSVYVNQSVVQGSYVVFLFKDVNTNTTDSISFEWNGKSNISALAKTVYLKVYNQITGTWEQLDFDNAVLAGTDFTLSGSIASNVGSYYNASKQVSAIVYQDA